MMMTGYLLSACLALANAAYVFGGDQTTLPDYNVYGYLKNVAIPEGERIRTAEEAYLDRLRIVGGVPAGAGQYPYQAGLLLSIIDLNGTGVCGGSLVSTNRVVTAAHCWFDGINKVWKATVVLGSNTLFNGGIRVDTSAIALHPRWQPFLIRNDVGVIYLPNPVPLSPTITPISLPSGAQVFEDFSGFAAIASGFGVISDSESISTSQFLSHVSLSVISNNVCSFAFPFIIQPSNICTSGIGGVGTCGGDSGGPLVVNRNGQNFLIGITSFGSALGCRANLPSVFVRVTSYVDFINQHL